MSWLGMDNGNFQCWQPSNSLCDYCGSQVVIEYGMSMCSNPRCPGEDMVELERMVEKKLIEHDEGDPDERDWTG